MKINQNYLDFIFLFALILAGLVLYFVPLHNGSFYFDDRSAIVNNEAIKHLDLPKIFTAFNTRFLVGLSFAFNFQWCGLHPAGWRLINILIHCLNAFLVYLLVKATLILYSARKSMSQARIEWAAFFAGLLFLCHPIQTEAVNSITQRFVLMGTFFYLLTLFLYIRYCEKNNTIYFLVSLTSAVAAMLCKEFVVTLPFMIALYDFYFLKTFPDRFLRRFIRILPFFAIAMIVPFLLLRTSSQTIRAANIADSNSIENHIDITRAKSAISRKEYFLTECKVLCTYVKLLAMPINQNFDYDYPISRQIDARTLLSGMFLLSLLLLAKASFNPSRIVSFCILWFFITLSIESSLIPIGHVIAEYRLYLASISFILILTFLIYTRPFDFKKINLIAFIILIVFSFMTFQRNRIWRDEFSLWDDTVKKSPYKARGYNNRGLEYYGRGDFNKALADFNKAIELNPDFAAAYNNRGVLFGSKGNLTQALLDFNKAIVIKPDYRDASNNRAFTYDQLKRKR